MEHAFWAERWAADTIGFHRGSVHPSLTEHAPVTFDRGRILVPLCGKSLDLAWLAGQGFEVVGIEFVAKAVEEFFKERDLEPDLSSTEAGPVLSAGGVTLHCADVLEVDLDAAGPFAGVWDRAAMVALPPPLRARYVTRIRGLVEAGTTLLLNTLDYDEAVMDGPPFSVGTEQVQAAYEGFRIEELAREDLIDHEPRWRERGHDHFVSTTYRIRA